MFGGRILRSALEVSVKSVRHLGTSTARRCAHVEPHFAYRRAPPLPPRFTFVMAEALGGFMWWWILWHFWTEPEHIYGHYQRPDPTLWTDEELGIPPDDAD